MANAAGISRVLKSAHFPRSVETATRIRGWHNTTAGFVATDRGDAVTVRWDFGSERGPERYEDLAASAEARLAAMTELLVKRGYDAVLRSGVVVVLNEVAA